MAENILKGRAEIPNREWVEFEAVVTDGKVGKLTFKAQGCFQLIEAARKVLGLNGTEIQNLVWTGLNHWDLLIAEAIDRLTGRYKFPNLELELCHCRCIPTAKVDQAIILGAHTVEKVREWTSANTACGTCRPEVEKLIDFRLKR